MLPGSSGTRSGACTTSAGGDGLRRRVFDHDALRAPVARGERGMQDREGYVQLEWRRAACRSISAWPGPDRWRDGGRALPGGLVAVFEHAVVRGVAGRERGVSVPWPDARVRAYRGCSSVIVMDNATGAGRRNAKGEVALTGVFSAFVAHYRLEVGAATRIRATRRSAWRTRSGFCGAISWCRHARGIVRAVEPSLLERCDGLARDSYCRGCWTCRGRGVRRGEGRVDAVAVHGVRPVRWESRTADKYGLVDIDSNRYLAGRFGAFQGIGRDPVGHGHARIAAPASSSRNIQTVRTVAQCGGSRACASPARGKPARGGKARSAGRADDIRAWLDYGEKS